VTGRARGWPPLTEIVSPTRSAALVALSVDSELPSCHAKEGWPVPKRAMRRRTTFNARIERKVQLARKT